MNILHSRIFKQIAGALIGATLALGFYKGFQIMSPLLLARLGIDGIERGPRITEEERVRMQDIVVRRAKEILEANWK